MKLPVVALAGSFAANVALLGLFSFQPQLAPPRFREYFAPRDTAAAAARLAGASAVPAVSASRPKLWSTLDAGGDLPALIARLRALGYPASVIRSIISAQISERYDVRMRRINENDPNTPFWKLRTSFYGMGDKRLEELNQLQRERSQLYRQLLADPFFVSDAEVSAGQRRQFGNLSRQKIDVLRQIEDDYMEMNSAIRAAMGGISLPEDREKLALLAREKHADLAAVLTPEELADYEMRSSQLTTRLRSMLGTFDPTEAEFRAIYQAQQSVNEKFAGGDSGAQYQQRQNVQQAFYDQLKASLGEARFADYTRELDREYQQLSRLAQREKLPAATAIQAFSLRESIAQESNRIFDDASLSNDQKRTALQLLAQNARAQFVGTLGPSVGAAYVKIADPWLTTVERGSAVSFKNSLPFTVMNDTGSTTTYLGGPNYRRVAGAQPPGR
jgi:hypothetical protein